MRPEFENQPMRADDETLVAPLLNQLLGYGVVQVGFGLAFAGFGLWFAFATEGWFVGGVFLLLGASLAMSGERVRLRKGSST